MTPYGNAKNFRISERDVDDINGLAVALTDIERNPRSFIVRGAPVEGIDRESAYRRLHARKNKDGSIEPATLRPASRHWVALDVDSLACPDGLDPVDDPDRALDYLVDHLRQSHTALHDGGSLPPGSTSNPESLCGYFGRMCSWLTRS